MKALLLRATSRRAPVVCVAGCALLLAGCDGYLGLDGQVFEWVGAQRDDEGFALVDGLSSPLPPRLVAVPGAEILVEPWPPEARGKQSRPELWAQRATSDRDGAFATGSTVAPGKFKATLTVSCDGYWTVEHVFRHDRFRHRAVVVLVKKGQM